MSSFVIGRPLAPPGPVRALAALEARRAVRSPWLWLGLALTAFLIRDLRHLDWQDGPYEFLGTAFVPLGLATFLFGLDAGSRDRRGDVPALAEEAVLGVAERGAARLLALWPLLLASCAVVTAAAIVERATGGLVLGERLDGVTSINHSLPEVLQPMLLFGLAGAAGVAGGRVRRARVPLALVGVLAAFMFGTMAWVFQRAPARYVTPLLTQPLRVPIDLDGRSPAILPADWVLDAPDQFHWEWQRVVVSPSMVAWHDVYLVGLITILVGFAIPSRWSRRLVALGAILAIGGVLAQILVAPDGISLAGSAP